MMNLTSLIQLIAFNIIFFGICTESFGKQLNPHLSLLHNRMCNNDTLNGFSESKSSKPKNFLLLQGLVFALTSEGQKNQLENTRQNLDISKLSEEERILTANILMMARTTDFEKIKSILDFSSQDVVIESYRLFFLGVMNGTLGESLTSYNLMASAIEKLPFIDESMLLSIFSVAGRLGTRPQNLDKLLNLVDTLPASSPMKYLLLANREMLVNGWAKKSKEITNFIKKAYEICPSDPAISLSNAAMEESNGAIDYAKDLYLEIIEKQFLYYPDVDARLLRIYYEQQNTSETKLFLENSKRSWQYLSPSERDVILAIEKVIKTKSSYEEPRTNEYLIGSAILAAALAVFLIWKRKRININPS